jgi:MFS family permease
MLQSNKRQKLLLLTIIAVFWFSQYVYIPYQATYLASIGAAPSLIGLIVGAYGFSQLALRMPAGLMADRKARHKPFLLLGVLLAGTASLFRILLPNEWGYLIGSILSGCASATWISFMLLFFTYYEKEELQKASGLAVGANNLGILIGFLTGTLLHEKYGMHLLCTLSFLLAIPAFFLSFSIREAHTDEEALPVKELVEVYFNKRLILFSLLALIQQGVQLSTAMSFTTKIAQSRGAGSVQIGICSIIYILTAVISSYFTASKAAQKSGARFWIPAILLCLAAYCVLIPNLPTVEWIYAAQILSGLSTGILFSFCTSEAMKEIPKGKSSTAMGFYQAVYAIGMTAFPVITGTVTGKFNIGTAYYILAGITVIGLAGAIRFYYFTNKAAE